MSNVKLTNVSNERYTPLQIVESARIVMGRIHLDPASSAKANEIVKAETFYTIEDDGLTKHWLSPAVFLNPPGGYTENRESSAAAWLKKLLTDYESGSVTEAIYIGFSIEQLAKFREVFEFPLCFTHAQNESSCITGSGRIKFLDEELKESKSPTHSNFIMYLPFRSETNVLKREYKLKTFYKEFSSYGIVGKFNAWN